MMSIFHSCYSIHMKDNLIKWFFQNYPFFSGLFFILPCIDSYQKVDLRTVSFDVPPQEVDRKICLLLCKFSLKKTEFCKSSDEPLIT